jgi:DMSO/TMAO reductase YedYZ molybdopterin-dependent catalytic subunit
VALGKVIHPPMQALTLHATSAQRYSERHIAPFFPVNGMPPDSYEFNKLAAEQFTIYALEITGLVARPLKLSLLDLRAMQDQDQVTLHHCIQGWSSVGRWGGVPMRAIIGMCQPLANAKYAVFWSYSNDTAGLPFYEALDVAVLAHPQAILALDLNGAPLSVPHGAPVRLRVETELGFKMVKWIKAIEFVEDYHRIRGGQGGSREDEKYYEVEAGV